MHIKNISLLFVIILFISCISQQPISSELTEEQLWAIALTGIMTEINYDSHSTLNSNKKRKKEVYLEVLRRDWGINNRNELLETLIEVEKDGFAPYLDSMKVLIMENNGNMEQIFKESQYSEYGKRRLLFVLENWEIYKSINIKSWDMGRNIALCRWGYDVGYLSEDEAWEKIMYFAKQIQPIYKSWNEYGFSYYLGRIFWASGFGPVEEYINKTEQIYKKLIGESGHWNKLKWDIQL